MDQTQRRHRPSLYDVAERAGVSHQTVARAVNGGSGISDATRARVLEVARAMDFSPNAFAVSLGARQDMTLPRSGVLGVVLDSADGIAGEALYAGLLTASRRAGYSVVRVVAGPDDLPPVAEAVSRLVAHNVDGVCLIQTKRSSELSRRNLVLRDVPAVVVGSPLTDIPSFGIDREKGIALAIRHLSELGHKQIQLVVGNGESADDAARARAAKRALRRAGLTWHAPIVGEPTADFGYVLGASNGSRRFVSAFIAPNSSVALGLVAGLRSTGVEVPDRFSVMAFGDGVHSQHFLPPLTIVHEDYDEVGELAVRALLCWPIGSEPESRFEAVKPTLVRGKTTSRLIDK